MRSISILLSAIAILLGVLVLRPAITPVPVQAQSAASRFYVEPGTTMLRKPDGTAQLVGKVFIDMRNGDVWGYPTLMDLPYPVDPSTSKPPVSQPMYLGRFDLSAAQPK